MKKIVMGVAVACAALATVGVAQAQNYPERPVRLIVPFPPGGGTDTISRGLGIAMSEINPVWNFVPDNRPGAGGSLGMDALSKATPDGYTIGMGQTSNLTIAPFLQDKLSYDTRKDFTPVALVASSPVVIIVPAASKYQNLSDLIADAKANPGVINSASPGNGTVAHLSSELLQQVAGFKTQHIPYKGFSAALNDLLGGQVDMFMGSVATALPQIQAGNLRALAVTSAQRSPQLPDVPTIAESGYPGFDAVTWFGIVAPAGTPSDVVNKLNAEINAALKSKDYSDRLRAQGAVVLGGTPEQFKQTIERDLETWQKVVKESGAKVD